MNKFKNRTEAGKVLGDKLIASKKRFDIILALPRGGVPVGVEIAKKLKIPLSVYVVKKLSVPSYPEFGLGAVAEPNILLVDEESCEKIGVNNDDLKNIIAVEEEEMARSITLFRNGKPLPNLAGKRILLVDDGVATGVTARAAIAGLKESEPANITFVTPVCSINADSFIERNVDFYFCLHLPPHMNSVGMYYENFDQVTDEEVQTILRQYSASFQ